MSEDEFRADLRWPTDPLGERPPAHLAPEDEAWEAGLADADAVADDAGDRTLAEEVERLADRVVERLRTTRTALEGELAELRTELAAVREGLATIAERPVPRPVAAAAPDLAPLLAELTEVRAGVDALTASITSERLDDLADELSGVQTELQSLRRRISLRAPGGEGSTGLSDDQLERLAAAVAAKLGADGRRGSR